MSTVAVCCVPVCMITPMFVDPHLNLNQCNPIHVHPSDKTYGEMMARTLPAPGSGTTSANHLVRLFASCVAVCRWVVHVVPLINAYTPPILPNVPSSSYHVPACRGCLLILGMCVSCCQAMTGSSNTCSTVSQQLRSRQGTQRCVGLLSSVVSTVDDGCMCCNDKAK